MRLTRLLRLLTLVKTVRQLRVIVVGVIQGFRSSVYIQLLLLIVVYIFSILAVGQFGHNDPAHFGEVAIAMVTLFQVSTLSSYSGISYIAIYGCDVYGDGLYDWEAQNFTVVEQSYKKTMWGTFPLWDCVDPRAARGFTEFFYVAFTTVSALVVLSLVVGAITMAMFSAFTTMELAKLYDERTTNSQIKKQYDHLSPSHDIGRKIDLILKDEPVPASTNTWQDGSTCFSRDGLILICFSISESALFQTAITCTIISVAFIVGIETDNGSSHFTEAFNHVALALFAFECVVKIIAQAITPQTPWERALGKYFSDNWNKVHPNENPATVIMSQPNHHNPSPSAAIAFFKTKKSS